MGRIHRAADPGDSESFDNPYWSPEEVASFATHPGTGRVLVVRPGGSTDTSTEACLREAGYCLGRLPITRDTSHLPLAAATFNPDVIYLTLEEPLGLCMTALETLAGDEKTSRLPIVALVAAEAPASVIEEAYSRSGCDFFRMGTTQVELLARTHLLVRLASRDASMPLHERPIPEAANAPMGERLDLRDPETGIYTPTYLRHRLPLETARALRYQRPLSVVAVRCPAAADSEDLSRAIARALDDSSRGVDLVARCEPDIFVVVLPETDAHGTASVLDRLNEHMEGLGTPFTVGSASLGVADERDPDVAFDAETLLRLACRRC